MLSLRATQAELIDHPAVDRRHVERSHALMGLANRFLGGARIVRGFVAGEARRVARPLRVLDLGSGDCALPLAVSRWARRRGLDVRFTCVECSRPAAELARRNLARMGDGSVNLVEGDILRYEPDESFDCAVGTLFFHHFDDRQVLQVIDCLRAKVKQAILINDLAREAVHHLGCRLLTLLASSGVRHDALLSIRRGFRVEELRRLLAGLTGATVAVQRAWLFRVKAIIRFQ